LPQRFRRCAVVSEVGCEVVSVPSSPLQCSLNPSQPSRRSSTTRSGRFRELAPKLKAVSLRP
jgi:hypothetical protein